MLLPGAMSIYNMIIARTFLQNSIPNELLEAAQLDGCTDIQYLFKVVLPAVQGCFSGAGAILRCSALEHLLSRHDYLRKPGFIPIDPVLKGDPDLRPRSIHLLYPTRSWQRRYLNWQALSSTH